MKKIQFSVFALALLFTSCKKDRTCTCTITKTISEDPNGANNFTSYNSSEVSTNQFVIKNTTKKAAEQGPCASYTGTGTVSENYTYSGNYNNTQASFSNETISTICKLN